jgi:hypothetical protein
VLLSDQSSLVMANTTPTSTTTESVKLSPTQEQLLRGLIENGGACAYKQIARVAYGLRQQDLPNSERTRLAVSLRHLEQRGLVSMSRRWGNMGYGQPELVRITDLGRETASAVLN